MSSRESDEPSYGTGKVVHEEETGIRIGEVLETLRSNLKLLIMAPIIVGSLTLAATYLISPTFTATTTFLPPQQAQSGAASALASLGVLGGLAGGVSGIGAPGERYVALIQTVTVSDRIIDQFKLMAVYDVKYRVDARKVLAKSMHISLGKKDGLMTLDFEDESPQRAADIANHYVDELRRLMSTLAITEAQQRRAFFEKHLQQSRDQLAKAQQALEGSGFSPGALKAEPKAAAEAYVRLKAEATAAEMRLGLLRTIHADESPEVRQQLSLVRSLQDQLVRSEGSTTTSNSPDYIGRYREYKYQEALFDLYARQFELARSDESREGTLIQVVDLATPPERKTKPKRVLSAVAGALVAVFGTITFLLICFLRRRNAGANEAL